MLQFIFIGSLLPAVRVYMKDVHMAPRIYYVQV